MSVPIGQPKAAVGLGAADLFGLGRSVDSEAGAIETDPSRADGVVGSGWDDESPFDAFSLSDASEDFRIESIVGIGGEGRNSEFAIRPVFDASGNADWGMEKDAVGGAENLEDALGKAYSDVTYGR